MNANKSVAQTAASEHPPAAGLRASAEADTIAALPCPAPRGGDRPRPVLTNSASAHRAHARELEVCRPSRPSHPPL